MIETDYCSATNIEDTHGSVWPLEPGQALYFDTYKYHGGMMDVSENYRTTVNMKCTDKLEMFD